MALANKVMTELKSTCYRPSVSLLGSREQLCINTSVQSLGVIYQSFSSVSTLPFRKHSSQPLATEPEPMRFQSIDVLTLINCRKTSILFFKSSKNLS